jgi:ribonuclease E
MLVQVIREAMGTKGALLTAKVSIPGRYLVLMPHSSTSGISRQIEGAEERKRFKGYVDALKIPEGMGVIVRTVAVGVTEDDFRKDLDRLLETYKDVTLKFMERRTEGLVFREDDLVTRTLRDAFTADMTEVYIDDAEAFASAKRFFERTMPQHLHVLRHYQGKVPIFAKFGAEAQVDIIHAHKVPLVGGGSIVIDQTEAMVTIDVNSGKASGNGVADLSLKVNLEAAQEVARQLRLRDLGGIIAIDFIDMDRSAHRKEVEDAMIAALAGDKARMEVGKINNFGVLMLTRQRLRQSLLGSTHGACPTCKGLGKVRGVATLALGAVRKIAAIAGEPGVIAIRARIAPSIADEAQNRRRADIARLESEFCVTISVTGDHDVPYGEMVVEVERGERDAVPEPMEATA